VKVADRNVLIIGLARSGEAVAKLLLERGAKVTINEQRSRTADEPNVDALEWLGATCVFGGHPLSLLHPRPDFIVKNPGIPYSVELISTAIEQGIAVYTEIEVASWYTCSQLIAITGSNGKTTTTTLVGEMLQASGKHAVVAGNIGTVMSGVVEHTSPDEPIVLEVSSFQLLGTETFHPHIACVLNIYPAHLDYHGTMDKYMAAKWRVFANQTQTDVAVLNYDNVHTRAYAEKLAGRVQVLWFSTQQDILVGPGCYVAAGKLWYATGSGDVSELVDVSGLALGGQHNLENALAAAVISLTAGASIDAVHHVLTTFRGVEHRLEYVSTVDGVQYVNDSKATNPQAALQALKSFQQPIVWIAGGLNRGDDFAVLLNQLRTQVAVAVLLGQSAAALELACVAAGVSRVVQVATLEEAVRTAQGLANSGDVILLSPACASWDMFSSFEERGRLFKQFVHTL